MKYLVLLTTILLTFNVQASRLIEVEDYYSQKTSDFIKSRYPRKAFSVFVKVDAEDSVKLREPASNRQAPQLSLPYLDRVNSQQVGFWDRKDVSLGTLISYLKSILIQVDIDGDFSDEDVQKFKSELFQHLKLSQTYDRVEINRRQWQGDSKLSEYRTPLAAGLAALLFLAGTLFFVFQFGVSRLVKGLSQPLSEIGKSAENVANSSSLFSDSTSSFQLANQRWTDNNLSADKEKWAKSEIKRLSAFLSEPSAELLQKIEEMGSNDPHAMGAIFSEMEVSDLQKLVRWSHGNWWRVAITQSTPLNEQSLQYINEISHLNIRENLINENTTKNQKDVEVKKILARLSEKQFGALLNGYNFAKAEAVLRLLPQTTMIKVGKYLYPGEWAKLLEEKKTEIKDTELQKAKTKALELCPLKTEKEIKGYFKESDLLKLLDQSNTKDERDIYRVLDKNSWIQKDRRSYYSLFLNSEKVLQTLVSDLPLEYWALALTHCDRDECETVYKHFTAKQRYILREYKSKYEVNPPAVEDVVKAKKRLISSFELIEFHLEKEDANEAVA